MYIYILLYILYIYIYKYIYMYILLYILYFVVHHLKILPFNHPPLFYISYPSRLVTFNITNLEF